MPLRTERDGQREGVAGGLYENVGCGEEQGDAIGAELEALRPLARVDWDKSSHFCVWDPPPESAALLEASVREDFKRFI